jgi:hypothetical protein
VTCRPRIASAISGGTRWTELVGSGSGTGGGVGNVGCGELVVGGEAGAELGGAEPAGGGVTGAALVDGASAARAALHSATAAASVAIKANRRISTPKCKEDLGPNGTSIQAEERVGAITFGWAAAPSFWTLPAFIDASRMPTAIIVIPTR